MGKFADQLHGGTPILWLNAHAYATRLLANGLAPWLDVASCVAWQRKLMGLLKPDVAVLPLAPVVDAWLVAHPELRETMGAKSRAVFPLKTLLADAALRAHLVELTQGLRAGVSQPLALVMPSPRAWVALAYQQAQGSTTEVGEDEADSAAMYIADFLRVFGETGVDVLLLEEADAFAPASDAELACYQPVLNVASHYRWDVGLQLSHACNLPDTYAFAIAPQLLDGTPTGIALNGSFWTGASVAPHTTFHYLRIPVEAEPEVVLQRLATLR